MQVSFIELRLANAIRRRCIAALNQARPEIASYFDNTNDNNNAESYALEQEVA